jgi:hypothetical protein
MRGGARVDSPSYPANSGSVWVQGVCVGWLRVSDDLSYWLVRLSKIIQMRKEQLGSVKLQPTERSARLCGVITNAKFNKAETAGNCGSKARLTTSKVRFECCVERTVAARDVAQCSWL